MPLDHERPDPEVAGLPCGPATVPELQDSGSALYGAPVLVPHLLRRVRLLERNRLRREDGS